MDIHHLKIFTSVYSKQSFTKASEQLNITQPTISEHIRNLEKELDCRLFDRLGRSIMPTREAETLYPRALRILEQLQKLKEDFAAAGGEVKGELIIGASSIPGTYILPTMALNFKNKHPKISFEIRIDDSARITEMVLKHELFCGLVGAVMEPKKLTSHPLVEDELILISGRDTDPAILKKKKEIYLLPFLLRELGSGTRKTMENCFAGAGIEADRLNIVAVFGSTASIIEALKAGLGVSIVSRLAVQEELSSGRLKEIKVPGLEMKRKFYLIHHKKRTLPNHYRAFCDYLQK